MRDPNDRSTIPLFGDLVEPHDEPRLEGQQERVEALMADSFWHTVPELQKSLKQRFGQLYSETSISARLRAMRQRGYIVMLARARA
jgi:hypothetical protein